jgi:hypothetical protein
MVAVLRAKVRGGRLVLDEPTELPEGAEVALVAADGVDDLDEADRARLHAALDRAHDQLRSGRYVDGDEVIARLRRTGT